MSLPVSWYLQRLTTGHYHTQWKYEASSSTTRGALCGGVSHTSSLYEYDIPSNSLEPQQTPTYPIALSHRPETRKRQPYGHHGFDHVRHWVQGKLVTRTMPHDWPTESRKSVGESQRFPGWEKNQRKNVPGYYTVLHPPLLSSTP
ncbi:hypothetical protein C7212DRAFT_344697 [Tuber magnatum]|uniref:Uncharacterized protein n=1 Tax=Tuber magnatum TaxID=42249 RepID=A0A317SN57_9PEZI|nr:hypothetical protein C7212DRAFT_344697 [Tuber magnatum]